MKIAGAIAAAVLFFGAADARPYDDVMAEARAAFETEDFARASNLLDEAQAIRPYSLFLTRNRILARVMSGRMEEAIEIAKEIADRGLVFETPTHEAFDRLRADPAFAPIAEKMAENAKPIGVEATQTEVPESGLLPEAITISRKRETVIGSVRTGKIVAIEKAGVIQNITQADGGVFDIEIRKNTLWAAVNNQLAYENAGEAPKFAAVVAFDADTGEKLREIRADDGEALFGDLEIAKDGALYVSDSITPRILKVAKGGDEFETFSADPRFANLQGIALDERRNRIFVADYLTGLFSIDLRSGAVAAIANPTGAHLGGIDGLYRYKGDLIGVQNGTSPQRMVRIELDKSGTTVESLTVLQQALPAWNEPTHGVVEKNAFAYIATSNWPAYDDDGALKEGARLEPLRIMSAPLN